jgi:hypothetical protein
MAGLAHGRKVGKILATTDRMTTERNGKSSSWAAAISQLPGYPRDTLPQPTVPQAAPARTVTPMKADDESEEAR